VTVPADFDWKNPDYAPVWAARIERLNRLRAEPGMLPGLKAFYADHPVEFITDWMCTFDPRNVERGIDAVIPFLLFPKQAEFVEFVVARWRAREDWLCEKSRDMGVSWLCVAIATWMWLFHPGTVVGFGSRKEEYVDKLGDPKSLFWKIREALNLLPAEFKPAGYSERAHALSMRIVNPENGSTIVGESGDNIGRGNRTSIYFKDESAFYERPDAIDAALSQTSNCKGDVSTPNGAGNPFYRKRHGGKIKVFVFDWHDDPRKDRAWYERQVDALDPVIVAQEIDRSYTASVSNAWISGEIVLAARHRGPADVQAIGPLMLGIDVARFGDDKCAFTFRRGRVTYPQIVFGQCDVVDVAGRAIRAIEDWGEIPAQIAVDTIGIGAGVADLLRRKYPRRVVDVNSSLRLSDGQNYNLRARMWRDLREHLKNGAVIPNDPELSTDLTALQYEFRGGALLMESKDEAKRRGIKSPDRADSLALTFAFPARDASDLPPQAETDYVVFS
jgi:phage terminase large subunit